MMKKTERIKMVRCDKWYAALKKHSYILIFFWEIVYVRDTNQTNYV